MTVVVPDPVQSVDVRKQRFVVTEIEGNALPTYSLSPRADGQKHVITLSCAEEGALGEELRVVWELIEETVEVANYPFRELSYEERKPLARAEGGTVSCRRLWGRLQAGSAHSLAGGYARVRSRGLNRQRKELSWRGYMVLSN